jgi:formylglycine-generating enzyme required for sulfatase activity
LAFLSHTLAQSPPVLTLQAAGGLVQLSVSGDAGSPCALQYAPAIAPGQQWLTLTNATLPAGPAQITDPAGLTNGPRFYRALISVPTNMLWASAGNFVMGSPTNEVKRNPDETQHNVTLTKGFYVGRYQVTQGSYLALMNTNPSYFTTNHGFVTDLTRPVERVRWLDASNFCFKLTQQQQAAGVIFTNWAYRLPTESEWEYACRAGTVTPFYYGSNLFSGMANFDGEYPYTGGIGTTNNPSGTFLNRTTSVGTYQPNGFGLCDMAGNVWEWCQDWYGAYPTGSVTNPPGPAAGSARVFRGGPFNAPGDRCRSACRDSYNPTAAFNTLGFRVVLAGR